MKKTPDKILLSPRVTEKGAYLGEVGVYIFNVAEGANKKDIAEAVHTIFKVWPQKIRIARIPRKLVLTRGTNRTGMTAGGKKAYVYLKKGDTIEIV
ncbi:50S ribosomal protein L23 [Candidatus Adlerbacteria bacterium RIFCSPLOWO2_01_FULL_51_16]|uniref:50S ribosomal protein L23 n=1 Tax=Candidatus Adlerbacteria bacterium RIFCSPLOWO2_01_FULL_51_16 TaxID=1797243 RepID=A0A1F4XJD7_9BACT|nr:MAG: 50S ribosomal protein L23 [Candidatus Adlerbacteria bacterium RIFCSPLOWO2_01_FULL_51_16]